ncbi:MAG TPA: single-stranded-DNA-specific exonuclease RecJ [Solirubrobacteraceae bacterium]|nr:single-stranded-DNA-specific exonuclease RecJ [Solirubrobacteraceae bacterium]
MPQVAGERQAPLLTTAPYGFGRALALAHELGVSHTLAQILIRRGHHEAEEARTWLAATETHDPTCFADIDRAVTLIADHLDRGSHITVHGDYDVDGICASAVLLRSLGRCAPRGKVDWLLPSRIEDGYGLSLKSIERLAARRTRLLITADCAITAVEEVAAARAAGIDVLVTDHHTPRPDGRLPDATIVHPAVSGYPCPDLCAAGVAYKLAQALEAGREGEGPDEDLDLVALATIADVVPLRGENRRLVRAGLKALATTAKPGLRALMRVARVDPGSIDAHAVGFRLAPRINAAGRIARADAGLELVLGEDEGRAEEIARELDGANAERRMIETRILFAAEAQIACVPDRPAYVLAGEDWHPGVIGIVAARVAERHHRPAVVIGLDGDSGRGSARSIPGFDLLAALDESAPLLHRYGGHRAAAGVELARAAVDEFRERFERTCAERLTAEDLVRREAVDAVVSGDAIGHALAEELAMLEPCGAGNPGVNLLVPAATFTEARQIGEGKHVRFSVEAGGARSSAVAFGNSGRLPVALDEPVDATFRLELNEYAGAAQPRLVLRSARPCSPPPIELLGEPSSFVEGVLAELDAPLPGDRPAWNPQATSAAVGECTIDRRGAGIAGTLADLVLAGSPVLAVCADAQRRLPGLHARLGGFALCSSYALERAPELAGDRTQIVMIDPPAGAARPDPPAAQPASRFIHLAWGEPELRFAQRIHELEYDLRSPLAALYRALRAVRSVGGEELEALLRGDRAQPRSPALAGRLLRVLEELGLVSLDREDATGTPRVTVINAEHTSLERSAAFRAYQRRYENGRQLLDSQTALAA